MRSPTLLILFIAAISKAALCAESVDIEAYGKCTEAGRARATPAVIMAACKGIADNGIPAAQYLIGITFLNADGVKSPQALVVMQFKLHHYPGSRMAHTRGSHRSSARAVRPCHHQDEQRRCV